MAFPSGPPVSFTDLRNEFGGTTTNDLGDYVRGGAFVPDTPQNAGVPTTPPISLGDFYGSQASTVTLSDYEINSANPTLATSNFTLVNDGSLTNTQGSPVPGFDPSEWLNPQSPGAGAGWECRAVLFSGPSPSGGTLNVWLNLGSNQTWTQQSSSGTVTTVLDISIGAAGAQSAITTGRITLRPTQF